MLPGHSVLPGLPVHLIEESVPHKIVPSHGCVHVSFKLPPKEPQLHRPASPLRGRSTTDVTGAGAEKACVVPLYAVQQQQQSCDASLGGLGQRVRQQRFCWPGRPS